MARRIAPQCARCSRSRCPCRPSDQQRRHPVTAATRHRSSSSPPRFCKAARAPFQVRVCLAHCWTRALRHSRPRGREGRRRGARAHSSSLLAVCDRLLRPIENGTFSLGFEVSEIHMARRGCAPARPRGHPRSALTSAAPARSSSRSWEAVSATSVEPCPMCSKLRAIEWCDRATAGRSRCSRNSCATRRPAGRQSCAHLAPARVGPLRPTPRMGDAPPIAPSSGPRPSSWPTATPLGCSSGSPFGLRTEATLHAKRWVAPQCGCDRARVTDLGLPLSARVVHPLRADLPSERCTRHPCAHGPAKQWQWGWRAVAAAGAARAAARRVHGWPGCSRGHTAREAGQGGPHTSPGSTPSSHHHSTPAIAARNVVRRCRVPASIDPGAVGRPSGGIGEPGGR